MSGCQKKVKIIGVDVSPVLLLATSQDLTGLQLLLHQQSERTLHCGKQQTEKIANIPQMFWRNQQLVRKLSSQACGFSIPCPHLSCVLRGPNPVSTGSPPSGVRPRWRSAGGRCRIQCTLYPSPCTLCTEHCTVLTQSTMQVHNATLRYTMHH